jgi:hypothetical protein
LVLQKAPQTRLTLRFCRRAYVVRPPLR